MKKASTRVTCGLLLLSLLPSAHPAIHQGVVLDGQRYDAKVLPPGASKATYAQIEFRGKAVLLFWERNIEPDVTLHLASEMIDDIHDFEAKDQSTKQVWKINVEDVDT